LIEFQDYYGKRIVMNITAVKSDSANISVTAKIEKSDIEKEINKIAKRLAKREKIDGFRKGKVPVSIIKRIYADNLSQEAESSLIGRVIDESIKKVDAKSEDVIGEPHFNRYDKSDSGIDVELIISLKPVIEKRDYRALAPKYEEPKVEESEIDERLNMLVEQNTPYREVKDGDASLQEGDQAKFDFVGRVDGKEFEGGKAEGYELVIGSKQFIAGFEEQMVGMKRGESREIKVKFPENYQSKDLAGKDAIFNVTLDSFKRKREAKLDADMIKRIFPSEENPDEKIAREHIKNQLENEKLMEIYQNRLKPEFIATLVESYNFDLPKNIVEKEIDAQLNQKAQSMSSEELEELRRDEKKLEKLRESLREDAVNSVKATFLIDALAKEENISVSDGEVAQTIYYEAMMSGQDPEQVIKYYQDNNLIPAIKMGIVEDKLFSKILKLDR